MHNIPLMSGKDLIKFLVNKFQYRIVYQKGSHVQLEKDGKRLTVPNHKEIAIGTMNAILKIISRHLNIDKKELITILKEEK